MWIIGLSSFNATEPIIPIIIAEVML